MKSKLTIKDKVTAAINELRGMNHGQLFQWSRENGLDSRAGFSAFKKALLANGIDYDALRSGHQAAKAEALTAACTHEITLYSDAKASCDRFAICDEDGEVVWYGRFFDDDRDGYNGEQSSGELSAALKALWFARQAANAAGQQAVKLTLIVDAQWLCSLSGKPAILAQAAKRMNLDLTMEWIRGTSNPADKWTTATGFKKWNDGDLASLITVIGAEPVKKQVAVVVEVEAVPASVVETKAVSTAVIPSMPQPRRGEKCAVVLAALQSSELTVEERAEFIALVEGGCHPFPEKATALKNKSGLTWSQLTVKMIEEVAA
ncbi:MAG: hypothetical protein KCHDKBKB_03038 [Elusimicrobia bacterium]|nr:hypothetical protein [Elusimicrobiota bacterium]